MKTDIYQTVTDKIVAELSAGAAPWVREWDSGLPVNAVTGRPYNGVNVLILWAAAAERGYQSQEWMTYRQAQEKGWQVRKGEKGTAVVFYKTIIKDGDEQDDEEKPEVRRIMRTFHVFNREQVDGIPEREAEPKALRFEQAEAFIQAAGARVEDGEPAYAWRRDVITMPEIVKFHSTAGYYATFLHELTHWTGHASRLGRPLANPFGSREYAFEELIAELGAAFLCAELGVPGQVRHAGYIQTWIEVLREDKRAIFRAAAAASRAADFLKSLAKTGERAA